jgi:hypothetical protein
MDPDPDPGIFVIDLQHANKKLICRKQFFCLLLFEGTLLHLHHFPKKKSKKDVTEHWESRFFILFLLGDRRIRIHTFD